MLETWQEKYARLEVAQVLQKYVGLRLVPSSDDVVIEGKLAFRVVGPDRRPLEDEYEIRIRLSNPDFDSVPLVEETGGRISDSFHKLKGNFLCLGATTALRLARLRAPSLLRFIERFVIPYLYSYSYFALHSVMPFGELSHGDLGIREFLAELFQSGETSQAEEFLALAGLKKRVANKRPCPCLSGWRLGRCHHREVNDLRKAAGRLWCRDEYARVVRQLGIPVSKSRRRRVDVAHSLRAPRHCRKRLRTRRSRFAGAGAAPEFPINV